jgi:hypothetical protein
MSLGRCLGSTLTVVRFMAGKRDPLRLPEDRQRTAEEDRVGAPESEAAAP